MAEAKNIGEKKLASDNVFTTFDYRNSTTSENMVNTISGALKATMNITIG